MLRAALPTAALLGGYNQGPSRYQKSAKLVHLSIQPAKEPFVARIFKSLSELEGGEELVRRRDQSPIRSRASHWRKSPLKPMLSATSAEPGFSGRRYHAGNSKLARFGGSLWHCGCCSFPQIKTKQIPDDSVIGSKPEHFGCISSQLGV
jgi:hypothetical protein